ncbi:MAG TPA: family 10 glycosylhydrolase [Kiritimatiellia bacterium]|nr:family 10 glycosylhydrolase [Kiritimatiellia bacterium]HPS08172.1 family 10 glycosylhydrolase [Kiritimatiellia bacterium]
MITALLRRVFFFVGVTALPALCAQTVSLLPPFPPPEKVLPGERADPAQHAEDGLLLPVRFLPEIERVYWDIPLSARIPSDATSLELEFSCPDAAPLRGLSVHLQSGAGWHSATLARPDATRRSFTLPRGLFSPEGNPGPWHTSRVLRLSAWRQTDGRAALFLHAARARTDTVAIVRASDRTAPGETAFAAALADRCARLLNKAGIPFAVIDDAFEDLSPFRILLLPYAPALADKPLGRLERFVTRKGKLIVFYNASEPLGALLGVRPGAWQGTEAGREWSALVCDPARLPGAPARIPHATGNIIPPFATPSLQARPVATWADETGRVTDQPACVLSDRGAWFAHVPPLAYPSAVTLMRSLVRNLAPGLQVQSPPQAAITGQLPAASPSELRAAWNTRATACHPRGWNGLMSTLAADGINALFIRWQSAGTALHEQKGSRPADTLTEALAAGKTNGVAVHAWVTCWALDGAAAGQIAQLTRENRLMRDAAGNTLPWLCPSISENRALLIDGLRTLARRGVQGLHLDYVRFPEATGCYAPATRHAFEASLGGAVAAWPADVLPGGPHAAAFRKFRLDTLTAFVREARDAVRAVNPAIRLSAAVFPTPDAAAVRGQDWPAWLRAGLIDFACPMIYTESASDFAASLDLCLAAAPAASLVPGLGTGADESQLDAATAFLQLGQVRKRRLAGFAFYAVDDELLTTLLPVLPLK